VVAVAVDYEGVECGDDAGVDWIELRHEQPLWYWHWYATASGRNRDGV